MRRLVRGCALAWVGAALVACNFDTHLGYGRVVGRDDRVPDAAVPPGLTPPASPTDARSADRDAGENGDASTDFGDSPDAVEPSEITPCEAAAPAEPACALPGGVRLPAQLEADIGASVRYYADGAALPAGRYRIEYVGGCRRVGLVDPVPWTVHAVSIEEMSDPLLVLVPLSALAIVLVDAAGAPVSYLPGTGGLSQSAGAYPSYEECIAANCGKRLSFDFAGGALGLRPDALANSIFPSDNDGLPAPVFRLTYLDCPLSEP